MFEVSVAERAVFTACNWMLPLVVFVCLYYKVATLDFCVPHLWSL
jgi:hypothetical protein